MRNISDKDSFLTARRLAREEGIFCGGSTGTAIFGALADGAKKLGPGKTGRLHPLRQRRSLPQSKCFNDDWMKDMGYLGLAERLGTVRELLQFKEGKVVFARSDESLSDVAHRMNELGISQMPIAHANGGPLLMVHEADLLQSLINGECAPEDSVVAAAKPMRGQVALDDPLSKVQRVFDEDNIAVVLDGGQVTGIISKIDVVEFLAARS